MIRGPKRYRSIYTSRRRRTGGAFKWVVGLVLLAALFFVGYSILPVLDSLVKNGGRPPVSSSSGSKSSSKPGGSSSRAPSSSSQASSAPAVAASIRGIVLPKSCLSDTAGLNNFISQARAAGVNLAVIDLKAENGVVNYASKLTELQGTGIIAPGAPDASVAAKALTAAGITPAARIAAFQDPLAPSAMRGTGVMYAGDHSINWLDPTNTRWLNPYNAAARTYIEDLAAEAVSLGYKDIFVDGVTFPTSGSPDKSGYFGDNLASKEQCLDSFTQELKTRVNAAGGKLAVVTTGAAAAGQAAANLGQTQDIFSYSGDFLSPNFCPAFLPQTGLLVGSTTLAAPAGDPVAAVTALAGYLKAQDSAKLGMALPFIQAYSDSSHVYTAADVKAEIAALRSAGIGGYVLYSPTGTYDYSALK